MRRELMLALPAYSLVPLIKLTAGLITNLCWSWIIRKKLFDVPQLVERHQIIHHQIVRNSNVLLESNNLDFFW